MSSPVTLVFDIGKTNKKIFLFDEDLNQVYSEKMAFEETPDEDGVLSENLGALTEWVLDNTKKFLNHSEYDVTAVNFCTYGASLVHLNKEGEVIAPFYNYLKPFP